jgi:hypothetical protein
MLAMLAMLAILRAALAAAVLATGIAVGVSAARAQPDPLPSWNDGTAKKSITDFVARDRAGRRGLRAGRGAHRDLRL